MSLIKCPECGNEISTEAVACPNCGRPTIEPTPVVKRPVVLTVPLREDGVPKWIIAPIVILGAVAIFLLFVVLRSSDDSANANVRNINVSVASREKSSETRERTENPPNQINVPPSSTAVDPPTSTTIPQTTPQPARTDGSTVPTEKGMVVIEARLTTKEGVVQSVRNERFYLLDTDLNTILSNANLEPINGQSLENSFGLAALYPEKYGDFQRNALIAIRKHIKYDAITDDTGKASMKDVKPDSYYLFGITKSRTGFAIWSSPVNITGGENRLNLSPARLNEPAE